MKLGALGEDRLLNRILLHRLIIFASKKWYRQQGMRCLIRVTEVRYRSPGRPGIQHLDYVRMIHHRQRLPFRLEPPNDLAGN